ncbi:ATP-binding protein [Salana multivorans]
MLALFPAMNYKPWYALGEFVDNALQSWLANQNELADAFGDPLLEIDIHLDRKLGTITVVDNAAGIATKDIGRAFTPASPPADTSGLSQFGIGMKSAAAWYAQRFEVTTTALGEDVKREVSFDIPTIVESDASVVPLRTSPAAARMHGTTLVLRDLNHPVPTGRTLGKVRDYLASIYRGFISDPRVRITVGNQRLIHKEPELLVAPRWDAPQGEPVLWRKEILIELSSGARVTGWAGILKKGQARGAGFALLYRGKVVKGAGGAAQDADDGYKPYELFGAGNSFESQRVLGELHVSGVPVSHTKDALLWVGNDEEELIGRLAKELNREPLPILRMAREYRATERGRAAQRTVDTAVTSVAEAISRIDLSAPPPAPQPELGDDPPAAPIEREIILSPTITEVAGERLKLCVVDEPASAQNWIRLTRESDLWQITINRSHVFMRAFANVPTMDLEPVLRLATAFALVQIRAERSGASEPRSILANLNHIVGGPLSSRIEA